MVGILRHTAALFFFLQERVMLLSTIVKSYRNVRVLCVGDVMLDHFLYGKVERISPEAPVPVFNFQSEKKMLGGAGNVVANLNSLGCSADILCFVGNDEAGREVRALLEKVCDHVEAIVVPGFPTIEKTRVIAGNSHLLRIDNERRFLCEDDVPGSNLEERVKRADIVLLSADPENFQRIDSRYLDIYLEKENQKCQTIPISRRFLSRLAQAHETILRYRAAPSAKGLAECVKKLESLSFEDVALQLEERELKAHPDFRREFEQEFE